MSRTPTDVDQQELQRHAGQWLREARQNAKITSRDFAYALGISTAQLSNYELGKHRFTDERAEQIAGALRLPIVDVRLGLGLWVPDGLEPRTMTPEEAITADASLRPGQRELALAMIETIRSQGVESGPVGAGPDSAPYSPDRVTRAR